MLRSCMRLALGNDMPVISALRQVWGDGIVEICYRESADVMGMCGRYGISGPSREVDVCLHVRVNFSPL